MSEIRKFRTKRIYAEVFNNIDSSHLSLMYESAKYGTYKIFVLITMSCIKILICECVNNILLRMAFNGEG